MIAFKEDINEQKAQIANAIASSIDNFLMAGNYKNMPYSLGTYSWIQDPDGKGYLFNVTIAGYNTDNTNQNISEKEQKKIDEAVQKAFQGLTPSNNENGDMGVTTEEQAIGGTDMTMNEAAANGATFSTEETVGGK